MNTTPPTNLREGRDVRQEATDLPVVFVYGTLKRGNRNAGRLSTSIYIGKAVTPPRFDLACLGYAPGMVPGGSTAVHGECYIVTDETLALLDSFEGHPWKYRRTLIGVTLDTGLHAYVWTYLLRRDYVVLDGGVPVPSGDWKQPEGSGVAYARRRAGSRGRRNRGGSLAPNLSERAREDAFLAFLLDSQEAETLAFGYCPECGDTLNEAGACKYCEPSYIREAIERWNREDTW